MKLTQVDIQNIDSWLKNRGFKYIDVRYELLDHLVSEYEQIENYPDLDSFLKERLKWCRKVEKEKQKAVNFGITKDLFRHFFQLFRNVKFLSIIGVLTIILTYVEFSVASDIFRKTLFTIYLLLITYQVYLMIFSGFGQKLKKEAISVIYLINIFFISQLPMHFFGVFPDDLVIKQIFYIPYIVFGILLSINAILFFHKKRKNLLINLEQLKRESK
jgi:hypothetical protein